MNSCVARPTTDFLLASALLGVASGMRSTVGLAAVLTQGDCEGLPAPLQHRLVMPAAGVAVAAELVLDKLPFTGSRLEPAGLVGRFVFAGAGATLLARRRGESAFLAAVLAIVAAAASAKIAHDLRVKLSESAPDLVVALAEDLAAVGTAIAAVVALA